ncbi:3-hydroxyacyl-CoA dehydratase 1 [Actinidia rufa]|uniref:Delta(3)-Delta(2)-enoyl-CoA isomerase n=1 Tax=Actinidia rufa TaxID=165716 RepID=A0A7J0E8A6_9ERIC|nr:3-hydroxyacyl-CoA dehydratase 1 [Actinidia rufa]
MDPHTQPIPMLHLIVECIWGAILGTHSTSQKQSSNQRNTHHNVHVREARRNILTLTGDDDHRLNPRLMDSLRSALQQVKEQSTRSSALITTARGKFFSNGFDLAWAQSAGSAAAVEDRLLHMVDLFKPEVADLISLPMPTIAAVTGHAAAAGMMLAMSHDYVLMRSDKGVLYMSELDIGMKFPDYFTALVRSKVGSAAARRDVMLRAKKVTASEARVRNVRTRLSPSGKGWPYQDSGPGVDSYPCPRAQGTVASGERQVYELILGGIAFDS